MIINYNPQSFGGFPFFEQQTEEMSESEHIESEQLIQEEEFAQKERILKGELIKQVVQTNLKAFTAALAMTGVTCFFVATPAIPSFFISVISMIVLSTLLHSIENGITYHFECLRMRGENPLNVRNVLQNIKIFLLHNVCSDSRFFRHILFARIYDSTLGILIHELGHAIVGTLLLKPEKWPKINIYPFGGGVTEFLLEGEWEVSKRAFFTMVAAGPAFAILNATAILGIAHAIKDTHPDLHSYLVNTAIMRIATHVIYALSALIIPGTTNFLETGHDFFILWKGAKIHPLASAATMIAVPLLFQCALWKISAYRAFHRVENKEMAAR